MQNYECFFHAVELRFAMNFLLFCSVEVSEVSSFKGFMCQRVNVFPIIDFKTIKRL